MRYELAAVLDRQGEYASAWQELEQAKHYLATKFYHDCLRHWLLFRQRLNWDWFELRYEELVAEPEVVCQRLLEFLELPWNVTVIDDRRRTDAYNVKTPTYDDVQQPLYRRADARWRNYEQQLEPALEILDRYAQEFGYTV